MFALQADCAEMVVHALAAHVLVTVQNGPVVYFCMLTALTSGLLI